MVFESELNIYQFMGEYGNGLLQGLDADRAFERICPGGLHPAWIIGHLGFIGARVTAAFGGTPRVDLDVYGKMFGIGTEPSDDPADHPDWDTIVANWRDAHDDVAAAAPNVTDEFLAQPNQNERMKAALPTNREMYAFVLTSHEAVHLGQLSTWRRVQGLPRLF